MRPAGFDYCPVASAEEALDHLHRRGDEARLLAGGQSLIPLMNFRVARPAVLIDLGACADLAYIRREGGRVAIGAMTRQRDAELAPIVAADVPLLARALRFAGPVAVRHRGTVGGSIAHADPLAELPAVALALDAEMVVRSRRGERRVPARDFFVAELTTAIETGEMLCEIRLPCAPPESRCWFGEIGNHAGGVTQVGAAACVEIDQAGYVRAARFALCGMAAVPVRLGTLERAVTGGVLDGSLIGEAVHADLAAAEIPFSLHDEADHRRALAIALMEDAFLALACDARCETTGAA